MTGRNIVSKGLVLIGLCSSTLGAEGVQSARSDRVIAAGGSHSLALASEGTVWEWGGNSLFGTPTIPRPTPVQVSSLSGVVAVAAGTSHNLALKEDGTVWMWNFWSTPVQMTSLTGIVAIAGGFAHSLALKEDGTVWVWGAEPVQVSGLSDVASVAGGFDHNLALKSDGTVWAWGQNTCGQLGDGTTKSRSTAVQVGGLSEVVAVAAGGVPDLGGAGFSRSLAVKGDGTVWQWGCDWTGYWRQPSPERVTGLTGVVAVAAGADHNLALKSDGTVWEWGALSEVVQVSGLTEVVAVAAGGVVAGEYHSLALKGDGTVWAWGSNGEGQLGDGTTTSQSTPVQVSGLPTVYPGPVVDAVVNAASFRTGPVAPGEIVSVFGKDMGAPDGISGSPNASGIIETTLRQTRVLFDGVAAPILFARTDQVNAIVPYVLAGKTSTEIQVEYSGVKSSPLVLNVADSAPGLFTLDCAGSGQGVILNEDGSLNSVSDPAPRGSIVTLFATGEGQSPPSLSVRIGDQEAEVLEEAAVLGLAGVLQVKTRVPDEVTSGPAVPIVLMVGEARSQAGVTVAVQ